MDQDTPESKAIVGSSGEVDQGNIEKSKKDSKNSDDGIMLENPVVSNSGAEVASDGIGIREPMDEGTSGNPRSLVNEVVLERTIVMNSGEIMSISGESTIDVWGTNSRGIEQETWVGRGNSEPLNKLEQESNHRAVLDTVVLVNSEENTSISNRNSQLEIKGPSKVKADKSKANVFKDEKQSCVIDMRCGSGGELEDCDGEKVCRICHLSSDGLAETTATSSSMELIQLGCGCKDELGIAHAYCAEAWFKLKGNRMCEICGGVAKNVTGVADNRYAEEWNHRRYMGSNSSSSDEGRGCWRGQPFCNFVMACLVVAFVLPWFFKVNMF